MLQFITDGKDKQSIVSQTEKVLEGGCKWIQLRMKDAMEIDFLRAAGDC